MESMEGTRQDMKHLKDFYAQLGRRVRELREAMGLSLEDLAFESGLDPFQVGRIERGEVDLTVDSLLKVALGLRTSPAALLKGLEESSICGLLRISNQNQ
jgi:transcriptional regulator with XRE-family HTH domain